MLIPYGKKEIELYHEGMLVKARMVGGGELPDSLKGSWTNMAFAKRTVENQATLKTRRTKED